MPPVCLEYVLKHAVEGNPTDVLRAMDAFGWNESRMINIGDEKGAILTAAVDCRAPKTALELGTYAGYSAIRIAAAMTAKGARLVSIDISPTNAAVATQMIHYAGTDKGDKTKVFVGTAQTHLTDIMQQERIASFDFVFLDHTKAAYLSDLVFLLDNKLLSKRAVVVADNMVHPGSPDYLEYVTSKPELMKTEMYTAHLEYTTDREDGVAITTLLQ
jgi:catechol O-methyltransferase